MAQHSDYPVPHPILTQVLLEQIHQENLDAGIKAKAFDTPFRFSDAGKCGRMMGLASLDVPYSDPPDAAGEWVMWLGTRVHEMVQGALERIYGPKARVEVRLGFDDCSGHCDCIVESPEYGRIVYELKTKNGTAFSKGIGVDRRKFASVLPEGPGSGAKIQGALSAVAADADLLIIGFLSMESLSKGLAEKCSLGDLDRVAAEWHYTRAEFNPWAKAELERQKVFANYLDDGYLPARLAMDDEMVPVALDPHKARLDWRCQYCSFLSLCRSLPDTAPVALLMED